MSDVHEGADISPLQRDGDMIVANYHCTVVMSHSVCIPHKGIYEQGDIAYHFREEL